MLKVAFCDDCERDREKIMSCLSKIETLWQEEFEMFSFESGDKLCQALEKHSFDVIILDILMEGLDGIQTAMKIRARGEDSKIIFISSYDERLRELFRVGTIAFIDKPVNERVLEDALRKAYDLIQRDNEKVYIYEKNHSKCFILLRDIIYFEAQRNTVIIHTKKQSIQYRDSLKNIWQQLRNDENFIMPSRSFIFHLKHISIKNNAVIITDTLEHFNIGRIYKEDTQNRYFNYMERRSH